VIPQLGNLVKIGKLKPEPFAKPEFDGLVRSGTARLKDAGNKSLHIESRFDLAYNAAHALSLAALRSHSLRSENRYIVFQCREHTLGLPAAQWRVLENAHRIRNVAEYEGVIDVGEPLVDSLVRVTREILDRVSAIGSKG
jgi:hypothetical protein